MKSVLSAVCFCGLLVAGCNKDTPVSQKGAGPQSLNQPADTKTESGKDVGTYLDRFGAIVDTCLHDMEVSSQNMVNSQASIGEAIRKVETAIRTAKSSMEALSPVPASCTKLQQLGEEWAQAQLDSADAESERVRLEYEKSATADSRKAADQRTKDATLKAMKMKELIDEEEKKVRDASPRQ